jgi:glutamate 5-kinase
MSRNELAKCKRLVIKVGTRVLVDRRGRPDLDRMRALVEQMAALRAGGYQVILVSSGAIGAGIEALSLARRPTALPELQMAAAVGQSKLMAHYDALFGEFGVAVGQVLLIHSDLKDRRRHLNARNTMMALLRNGIVPVVNENDVVAVDEIRFGDNDQLASLVTMLVDADLLLLLSTTNGLRAPVPGEGKRTRRIPFLSKIDDEALALAWGKGDQLSTGGMKTKLEAARSVVEVGGAAIIADGRKSDVIKDILSGKDVGTLFGHPGPRILASKKRWIAFFQRPTGHLIIDEGAERAILRQGKSLLPIGIRAVEGQFGLGATVNIKNEEGKLIARGLAEYTSDEIATIKGHRTAEIPKLLGDRPYDEVIHRDNMVLLQGEEKK